MSNRSYTDLGGGIYRLDNTWRAVMDPRTACAEHMTKESGMSEEYYIVVCPDCGWRQKLTGDPDDGIAGFECLIKYSCEGCDRTHEVNRHQYEFVTNNGVRAYARVPTPVIAKHQLVTVCSCGGVRSDEPGLADLNKENDTLLAKNRELYVENRGLRGELGRRTEEAAELRAELKEQHGKVQVLEHERDHFQRQYKRHLHDATLRWREQYEHSAVAGATGVGMSRVLPCDVDYDW